MEGQDSPPEVERPQGNSPGPRDADGGRRRQTPAASGPGGLAAFSDRQLEQLRGVVRDAIREEVAARLGGGGRLPFDWLAGAGVRAAAQGAGKAADEPVAAEVVEGGSFRSGGSEGTGDAVEESPSRRQNNFAKGAGSAVTMLNKSPLASGQSFELDGSVPAWERLLQAKIHRAVHSQIFDTVMGLIILGSCACMGVEVQLKFQETDVDDWLSSSLPWLDSFFLICFITEAGMRVVSDGKAVFSNPWFKFDVVLVAIGASVSWVLMPIVHHLDMADLPIINQVLTLRVLRLLRTVRAFRTMEMFSEMCRLCSGLLRSCRTMLSVCLLVMVAVFTFSVLGADLIFKSEKLRANDVTAALVEKNFCNLGAFMLTLMQFTTADSLAGIYYPMIEVEPLLGLYFVALWVVITVALMNLVTAVIVDNALALGREEAEVKEHRDRKILQKNLPGLEELFDKLDNDGSGSVTHDEIKAFHDAGLLKFPTEVQSIVDADHLVNMFEFMDKDKSGEIDKEEFVEGVVCLALNNLSIETLQILQILKDVHKMMQATVSGA